MNRFMRFMQESTRLALERMPEQPRFLVGTARGNESNATLHTLMRRTTYGGRKARRADRRLVRGQWGPSRIAGYITTHKGTSE